MGAFHFIKAINGHNAKVEDDQKIKPIIGCEFYVCDEQFCRKKNPNEDDGYQIVFLAKNKAGYHNLAKLTSAAYVDGFYYVPRIDKELVKQYKDHLIVLSGNKYGDWEAFALMPLIDFKCRGSTSRRSLAMVAWTIWRRFLYRANAPWGRRRRSR